MDVAVTAAADDRSVAPGPRGSWIPPARSRVRVAMGMAVRMPRGVFLEQIVRSQPLGVRVDVDVPPTGVPVDELERPRQAGREDQPDRAEARADTTNGAHASEASTSAGACAARVCKPTTPRRRRLATAPGSGL